MLLKSSLFWHLLTFPVFILLCLMVHSLSWKFVTAGPITSSKQPCKKKDLPIDHGTETCSPSGEFAREQRLKELQIEILKKLGLQKAPNVTRLKDLGKRSALHDMLQFAEMQAMDHDVQPPDDNYFFKPYNMIIHGQHLNLAKKDHFINTIGGIYFDLDKRIDSNVKLDKAVLRLFIRRRRLANETSMSSNDTTATLTIGVIKAPDTNRSTHQSQELTPSIYPFNIRPESAATSLLNSSGFWVSLDVKKLVHRWITDEKENHGIRLEARLPNDLDGYNYAVTPQNLEKNEEDLIPYLELIQKTSGRRRRSLTGDCQEGANQTDCCRYPLKVQLQSLMAFNFIVWPLSFDAFYCRGSCKDGRSAQHSLQNHFTARSVSPPEESANYWKVCCSASTKSDLFIVYQNEQNDFIGGTLPGMIVQRCSCS